MSYRRTVKQFAPRGSNLYWPGAKLDIFQQSKTAGVLYILLQLPPGAEAVLTCNYEPRVEKVCVGQVSQGLNRVASSKRLRVSSL